MTNTPGFVDLQVNGFDGVDFNGDDVQGHDVARVCRTLKNLNMSGILATVITDDMSSMCRRLARIRQLLTDVPSAADVIWGIHIEGPFLNEQPGYIGAHPPKAARWADPFLMEELLCAAGDMVRIVTLAPERDPDCTVIKMLVDRGIRVAAGHCNPSIDQLQSAIDAGLSVFTHLGNGCPLLLNRHDNVIQRVLSVSDKLWIGFIADGVHVPLHALHNYLRLTGFQKAFVVTDSMHAAGRGPGTYRFGGHRIVVDEHRATWDATRSNLVGSASTMPDLIGVLRNGIGLSEEHVRLLTSINPRQILSTADASE